MAYKRGDMKDKLATLGERSVYRLLIDERGHEFFTKGWKYYNIHESKEKAQKKEVDLIEEWTDAAGKRHKMAHEVKTEAASLYEWGGYNGYLDEVYGWTLQREHLDHDGQLVEKWNLTGTGNTFIETVQRVGGNDGKGWAYVLRDTQKEVNAAFSEGRSVWVVQYAPRSVPQPLPEGYENYVPVGEHPIPEPYNFFTALQIPDGYIIDRLGCKEWEQYKTKDGRGYAVPLKELYNTELFKDGKFERRDDKTGAVFYRDRTAWEMEAKDIYDKWTREDFIIEPFELKQ